jgi:uncharacterized protein (DUF1778 family)
MNKKEKAVQIRCLPEYKARIKAAADSLNMSVSGFIIMQINAGLKEFGK